MDIEKLIRALNNDDLDELESLLREIEPEAYDHEYLYTPGLSI
jgi:hypothetical protein